jgi:tetrahydromethanopterin S-methyltransferase subunit D
MRPNLIATGPGGGKPADRAHSRGVVGVAVLLNGGRGLVDCARSSIMSSTAISTRFKLNACNHWQSLNTTITEYDSYESDNKASSASCTA